MNGAETRKSLLKEYFKLFDELDTFYINSSLTDSEAIDEASDNRDQTSLKVHDNTADSGSGADVASDPGSNLESDSDASPSSGPDDGSDPGSDPGAGAGSDASPGSGSDTIVVAGVSYSPDIGQDKAVLLNSKLNEIADLYIKNLPVATLSRCPFTGNPVSMQMDYYGLDGPFWDFSSPARESWVMNGTLFAVTGAVKLNIDSLEDVPFKCFPGPSAPFVLPEYLQYEEMKAVISSFMLGSHTAYVIAYFSDPVLFGLRRVDSWGMGYSEFVDADSTIYWGENSIDEKEMDFDLEKYILSGRLLWIAPGDVSMMLQSTTEDCPFIGLEGDRRLCIIQNGSIYYYENTVNNNSEVEYE